mgnify:CR=1 FL=1|jgi:hypothetical protein
MGFQEVFGDDEHTAAEGPYSRLLKVRKWIFVSGGLALITAFGLYDARSFEEVVQIISLPESLLKTFLFASLFYLIIIYTLLFAQLSISYKIILDDRLAFRRQKDLSDLAEKIEALEGSLNERFNSDRDTKRKALSEIADRMSKISGEVDEAKQVIEQWLPREGTSARAKSILTKNRAAVKNGQAELRHLVKSAKELENELGRMGSIQRDRYLETTESGSRNLKQWRAAKEKYDALVQSNPGDKPGYRRLEQLIDAFRIGPPFVFGLYAGARLLLS